MDNVLLLYPSKEELSKIKHRAQTKRWKQTHPEKVREYEKKRTFRKSDISIPKYKKRREKQKEWKKTHPEKTREHSRNQYRKNPKKVTEQVTKWRKANQECVREKQREWREKNPSKASEINKKHNATRKRELGFTPLNQWFNNSIGHHIDTERVIYIPTEIHCSHPHTLKKPETMLRINAIAIYYLNPAILPIFK